MRLGVINMGLDVWIGPILYSWKQLCMQEKQFKKKQCIKMCPHQQAGNEKLSITVHLNLFGFINA